ncbi:hypothetical protein [Kitasatospora aureofaciens]|uniref:hypothetical protein n=1 Tax=Kitasatospora aureofaciens TaxID=1894 RepID=UPI00340AA981
METRVWLNERTWPQARTRRTGWSAWPHGSTTNHRDRYPTRERATMAGADSWLRIVTAEPQR